MAYDYFGDSFFPANYWQDDYWPIYVEQAAYIPGDTVGKAYTFPGAVLDYTSKDKLKDYTFNAIVPDYTFAGKVLDYTSDDVNIDYTER